MSVAEILHALLSIAAGEGGQMWLHDEIDKLEHKPAAASPAASPGFTPAPSAR